MDKQNKVKKALKLAQDNPGINLDDLMSLIGIDGDLIDVDKGPSEIKLTNEDMEKLDNAYHPNSEQLEAEILEAESVMDRSGRAWTDEENKQLLKLRGENMSYTDISQKMKRTELALQLQVSRLQRDLKPNQKVVYRHQYTRKENTLLFNLLERYNFVVKNVPDYQIDLMAREIGVTHNAVTSRLHLFRKKYKNGGVK